MSVWLDGTVGHLQKAVHSLSENKQDHKLLEFFSFLVCVCMWVCVCVCGFFSSRKERKWHFLNPEVRGSALPTSAHTHTNSLSSTSDCRRQTFPGLCPSSLTPIQTLSMPLILLFHEDWPSHVWLPGPPPSRSYYLNVSDFLKITEPESRAAAAITDCLELQSGSSTLLWMGWPWGSEGLKVSIWGYKADPFPTPPRSHCCSLLLKSCCSRGANVALTPTFSEDLPWWLSW